MLTCPECGAAHHGDCWQENGGCAITGCAAGPVDDPNASAFPPAVGPAVQDPPLPPVGAPAAGRMVIGLEDLDNSVVPPAQVGAVPGPPKAGSAPRRRRRKGRIAAVVAGGLVVLGVAVAGGWWLVASQDGTSVTEPEAVSASAPSPDSVEEDPGSDSAAGVSEPQPPPFTQTRTVIGSGMVMEVPDGDGWEITEETQEDDKRKWTVIGPDDRGILIIHTPFETARPPGAEDSGAPVPGAPDIRRFALRNYDFRTCASGTCTDYIVNDYGRFGGIAVLAEGTFDTPVARAALAIARSIEPA